MQELGLIGLRIQRMPNEPGLEFGIPSQYSYMTVKARFRITLQMLSDVMLLLESGQGDNCVMVSLLNI